MIKNLKAFDKVLSDSEMRQEMYSAERMHRLSKPIAILTDAECHKLLEGAVSDGRLSRIAPK